MKTVLKYSVILLITAAATLFTSCSSDENSVEINELENLVKFKEITNETHTIELYSESGALEQGFNDISVRIKDKATGEFIKNAQISWLPIMHMAMMNHSCPKSDVKKVTANGTIYNGYIVFQMAQNTTEYWELKIDYTIGTNTFTASSQIDVPASQKRRVTSFMGSDGARYIIAYVAPAQPKVATNDAVLGVWKMQDMMNFPAANGYSIKLDPRMPGMGNHGSPNNVDAKQQVSGGLYYGKLSLTMTGYWKINLQLLNAEAEIVKGEAITDTQPESSIFFELEF